MRFEEGVMGWVALGALTGESSFPHLLCRSFRIIETLASGFLRGREFPSYITAYSLQMAYGIFRKENLRLIHQLRISRREVIFPPPGL